MAKKLLELCPVSSLADKLPHGLLLLLCVASELRTCLDLILKNSGPFVSYLHGVEVRDHFNSSTHATRSWLGGE